MQNEPVITNQLGYVKVEDGTLMITVAEYVRQLSWIKSLIIQDGVATVNYIQLTYGRIIKTNG